jgi:hypothetical protein
MKSQAEGVGVGLDNLLMSMYDSPILWRIEFMRFRLLLCTIAKILILAGIFIIW